MNEQQLLYFMNFLVSMGYALIAPVVPDIILNKGGTSFISGLFLSTFSITQLIAIIYCPGILRKLGRKNHFIYFTIIQTLAIFLYSVFNKLNGLFFYFFSFLVRAIHGFSDGALIVTVFGTTNIISKGPNLKSVLGNLEFFGMIGSAIAPLIISIFYFIGGYSLPFIITTLISLFAVYNLTKIDFNIKEEKEKKKESKNTILPYTISRNTFIILLVATVNFIGQFFYYPTLTNYLNKNFDTSIEICSIFFMIPIISYWISLCLIQKMTDKLGMKLSMFVSLLITIIGCFFIAPFSLFPLSIITIALGLLIQGYGQPLINIPLILESSYYLVEDFNLSENDAGDIASAFYILSFNIGTMSGSFIGGFLTYKFNFQTSSYFSAFICLIIALFYFLLYKEIIINKIKEIFIKNDKTIENTEIKNNFLNNII